MSTIFIPDSKWQQFARLTVLTGDLDPMYDLISNGRIKYGREWATKYALHFFMFYDAGQAAALANADTELDFWRMCEFGYEGFKRGTERRHFRGERGRSAMRRFASMGSPSSIWNKMHAPTYTALVENIEAKFGGCQIGPYFAWKAMDILDRCLDMPVSLSLAEAVKYMPDEPRKCALKVWPEHSLGEVLQMVTDAIKELPAAGALGKNCGYAEAETILCMMKGYFITKTHTIGDDVAEKHNQLADHPYLKVLLPPNLDWDKYVNALDSETIPA